MKCSRAEVHCKTHSLPQLRFEDSQLTSFSGLILIQELFLRLGLKERLRRCFSHLKVSPIFGYPTLVLCLVTFCSDTGSCGICVTMRTTRW